MSRPEGWITDAGGGWSMGEGRSLVVTRDHMRAGGRGGRVHSPLRPRHNTHARVTTTTTTLLHSYLR